MSKKIKLGKTTFSSLEEASKSLNLKSSTGLKMAIKNGKTEYHGMPIQLVRSRKINDGIKFCPVHCETLNKTFKTITQAAKFAGVNDWTMSKKMTASGQFIDDKGNVYKRLKPMNSKNIYEDTGSTMKIKMPKNIKRKKVDEQMTLFNYKPEDKMEEMKPEMEVIEPETKIVMKSTTINEIDKEKIAKEVLKEKMKEILNTDNMEQLKTIIQVYEMM